MVMGRSYGSVRLGEEHLSSKNRREDPSVDVDDVEVPRETDVLHLHHDSPIPVVSTRPCLSWRMIQSIVFLSFTVVALFGTVGGAWTSRRPPHPPGTLSVPHVASVASSVAAVATLSIALLTGTAAAAEAVDFSGSYADPFHPNCQRLVEVVAPTRAAVSGTDGTPGCPPDGGGRPWALTGIIDGDSILIDFTPKGGPKDLKGVWEPSPVAGIRFPDGNLWSKKPTIQ